MTESKPRMMIKRKKMKRQNRKESNGKRTSKMMRRTDRKVKTNKIMEPNRRNKAQ